MTDEQTRLLEDLRVRLESIKAHSCTPQLKVMLDLALENLEELGQELRKDD